MRRLTGAFLMMIALGVLAEARQQSGRRRRDLPRVPEVWPGAAGLRRIGARRRPRRLHACCSAPPPTPTSLQLMSLPAANVDLDRTRRYANTIRAKHYAATRGELDYAAMSQEVQRTLGQLPAVQDPRKRLEMALEAKKRLMTWAEGTYGYRAGDVRVLTNLFDEVINELRAAAGEKQFALDLRVGQSDFDPEPLLRPPTLRECIELALAAADGHRHGRRPAGGAQRRDRRGRRRSGRRRLARQDDARAWRREPRHGRLRVPGERTYALRPTPPAGRATWPESKRRLPRWRPAIRSWAGENHRWSRRSTLSSTPCSKPRARIARKSNATCKVRGSLLAYERRVRPTMSGFDGLLPVLTSLRDTRYTAYERLERASARLASLQASLAGVEPPEDLVDVHASLASAMQMADHAVARRKRGISTAKHVLRHRSLDGGGRRADAGPARPRAARRPVVSAEDSVTATRAAFQRRTLVRARDLAAFRAALVDLATTGRPLDARRRAVVVPTRASGELLRQTIEARCRESGARLPAAGLRHARGARRAAGASRLPRPTVLLSRAEREVLLERAARHRRESAAPRRRAVPAAARTRVRDARLLRRAAAPSAHGAAIRARGVRAAPRRAWPGPRQRQPDPADVLSRLRLPGLRARGAATSGAMDEHGLRDALLETSPACRSTTSSLPSPTIRQIPRGLWPADFDLIGRLRHLARVDVVVTDGLHDAGFRERIEEELPGIEEGARRRVLRHAPVLRAAGRRARTKTSAWVSRDREEELRDVARTIHERAESGETRPARADGVVFHRPLPYLYLVSTSSGRRPGAVSGRGRAAARGRTVRRAA